MHPGVSEGSTLVAEWFLLLVVCDKAEPCVMSLAEAGLQMGQVGKTCGCLSFQSKV